MRVRKISNQFIFQDSFKSYIWVSRPSYGPHPWYFRSHNIKLDESLPRPPRFLIFRVSSGARAGGRLMSVSSLSHSRPRLRLTASKLCDPTLEKSHLHESQVTINCQNGQLKEYRLGWLGKSAHWASGGHTQRNKMARNSAQRKPKIFLLRHIEQLIVDFNNT